jgi:uncharacterized protein YlaI
MSLDLEVKCLLCGKKFVLTEEDPDYDRIADRPNTSYICPKCRHRVKREINEGYHVKPM